MSQYTLAQYFRDANIFEIPDWFYGVYLRHKPWKHQIDDLKFCCDKERFGIFNDAGTGKTLGMQAMLILYCAGYGNKGVVCMPPALIGQFMESFFHPEDSYFLNLNEFVNFKAFSGTKKKKDQMFAKWKATEFPDLLVMSYRQFSDMHPLKPVKEKRITNSKTGASYVRPAVRPMKNHPLKELGFNVLFFDEAQALKNTTSGISKKVFRYIGVTEGQFMIGLFTGSPIANELIDAYGMIKLITPDVYPTLRSFERKHCIYAKDTKFRTLIGYDNRELLNRNLYLQARRVTKQEAIKDLPPMIPTAIPVEISDKHRKLYNKLMRERVLDLPDGFIDATDQQKLRQVALQMVTMPDKFMEGIENEVLNTMDEKIEAVNPYENKVIIFSFFRETVEYLAKKYEKYNPAIINGASGNKDAARKKFRDDDSCRMIILNWIAGGAGLNFQISTYLFFFEQPTVPSQALQAIARSHRGGQDKPVNVFFFKVTGTIMAKSLKKLLKKDYDVNTIVRDKHKMLHELLGEYY